MKLGQLGRADLLTAIINEDHQTQDTLAEALGLSCLQKPDKEIRPPNRLKKREETEDKALHRSPTANLSSRYWQLVKQKNLHDDKKKEQPPTTQEPKGKAVWQNRPLSSPDYPALTNLKDVRSRLFSELHRQYHGRQHIDIPFVIDKLSRAELVEKLPRKEQQHNLQSLQIIDDRQLYLTPYWLDHVWVTMHLYDEFAGYQISRAVLQNGDNRPQLISDHAGQIEYKPPPVNTPVLILSDLGRLSNNGSNRLENFNCRQKQYWRLARQFLANANPVIVLTPCHPKDYPLALRRQIQFVSWESHTTPLPDLLQKSTGKGEAEMRVAAWIELLRTLVSPAIRLEPQMLRSLRHGLRQYGYKIPAAVEALLWQHPDVKEPHNIAATLNPLANRQYRKKFAELRPELQALALRTLKQWRAVLPPEIWFEEVLGIESMLDAVKIFAADEAHEFHQDVDDACDFLQQIIDQQKLQGDKGDAYYAWVARLETRISEAAVQTGKGNRLLQTVISQVSPDDKQSLGGYVIDPDLLPPTSLQKQAVRLCQYGNRLAVGLHRPTQVPQQNTSMIAPIEYRHLHLKVLPADGKSYSIKLPSQGLARGVISLQGTAILYQDGVLTFKTDHTELFLQAMEKPAWAIGIGRDAYGLFTDVKIAEKDGASLIRRFRWIPAGEFMMGSPGNEVERFDYEDYHRVTLTRGYWLAETAVTQAVWQAVTGENPSNCKGEQNPVETVSWDDAQTFIKQLNEDLGSRLSGLAVRLPTEAEWEHACRAGTDTPFSFGANITPEQVNYHGDYPYADGEKGLYRKETVPVKSLLANPWGLYEMHGNVWEWCADSWLEHLGAEPVSDPYQETGSDRVLRGGSWYSNGRYVRSAYRLHLSPGRRGGVIGFRLALGHVSSSRGSER